MDTLGPCVVQTPFPTPPLPPTPAAAARAFQEFDWLFKGRAGQGFMPEGWEHMTYDPSKSAGSPGHPRGTSPGDVPWWKDAAAARGVAPRRVDWTEAG